ncbi:ABC transporter permease [Gordonia sp. NPDC003585]|uniref:ABC transporter permease n=1 Tax=unclassified Gordonia (in: high G+C Gram-positive bacteria) TaxID=2657482 RepID=UPI0033AC4B36
MTLLSGEPLSFGTHYRRLLIGVVVLGALTQFLLGTFYLGVGHSPEPRNLPVGIVGPPAQVEPVAAQLESAGKFDVTSYPSPEALTAAIRARDAAGGLEITSGGVVAVVAGAGGTLPAATLKTVAAEANQRNNSPQTIPRDVVPLADSDINGASLGYILQVISLGGSIASLGLGRLMPRVQKSLRRGLGHVAALIAYALVSAAIVLAFSSIYGVGSGADTGELFWTYALISLAITGSISGLVTLFGPVGSLTGGFYFLIGATISGASIPWTFLPHFWALLGQWLPTGGGAQLIRNSLYFPAASNTTALLCLGLYAGIGTLLVLVWNIMGNRDSRTSAIDVDALYPVTGEHHHHHDTSTEAESQP